MKNNYLKKHQGFSLVEMLVSISILLLVITGPMTITSRTAKSSTFATEQVQAFFLAQEGLEMAQKLRDDRLLLAGATPWSDFTNTLSNGANSLCYTATGCGLEWDSSGATLKSPEDCSSSNLCRLHRKNNPDRSLYTYSASDSVSSLYSRKIKFTNVAGNSVRVVSTVTWRTGSLVAEQKVEVETYLYNIYDSL